MCLLKRNSGRAKSGKQERIIKIAEEVKKEVEEFYLRGDISKE